MNPEHIGIMRQMQALLRDRKRLNKVQKELLCSITRYLYNWDMGISR